MYGPQRKAPCPMCTSFLSAWNGIAANLRQRVAIAVAARSPIGRLIDYKNQRGFTNLPLLSDGSGEYTRTYVNADDADVPGFSVFTKRDGIIRHFYSGEMDGAMAEPGQDPRGAPDLDPLWLMLDLTPEGRVGPNRGASPLALLNDLRIGILDELRCRLALGRVCGLPVVIFEVRSSYDTDEGTNDADERQHNSDYRRRIRYRSRAG